MIHAVYVSGRIMIHAVYTIEVMDAWLLKDIPGFVCVCVCVCVFVCVFVCDQIERSIIGDCFTYCLVGEARGIYVRYLPFETRKS